MFFAWVTREQDGLRRRDDRAAAEALQRAETARARSGSRSSPQSALATVNSTIEAAK